MSVHNESLEMGRPVERVQQAPTLEYNTVRNDSLTMFGAAIDGALLGMLLTLLVLAVVNGGTLSFSGGSRLDTLQANVDRINENVGALSYNLDVVSEQARTMQTQLATVGQDVEGLSVAVENLNRSSTQFTTFLTALDQALAEASAAISGEGE